MKLNPGAVPVVGRLAIAITELVLFTAGGYKARVTVGRPARSWLEMVLIGTVSALQST